MSSYIAVMKKKYEGKKLLKPSVQMLLYQVKNKQPSIQLDPSINNSSIYSTNVDEL